MSTHGGRAQFDGYLSDLAARLRGPRRHRERILAELRDGLDHAVTGRITAGLPGDRAVAAAIAEFGTPQAVADAFVGELATAYARRTIAWYITTGPLVGIWWLLLLRPDPWRTGVLPLMAAIPVLPLIIIAIAIAAGTFAATGRLMRWLPEASPTQALAAATAVAVLAVAGDLTVIAISTHAHSLTQPLAAVAFTASLTRIAGSLIVLRHATAMRRAVSGSLDTRPVEAGDHDVRR